ncbi:MAG: hypothetical protein ABFD51_14020 [Anaerolineaceae bacterium]
MRVTEGYEAILSSSKDGFGAKSAPRHDEIRESAITTIASFIQQEKCLRNE